MLTEELGLPPYGAEKIEFWISEKLTQKEAQSYVADQILTAWSADHLDFSAKVVAARFCLMNGFRESLSTVLRAELKKNANLVWAAIWPLVGHQELTREEITELLTGAAEQNQLLEIAVAAQASKHPDNRWSKILKSEKQDLRQKIILTKNKLIDELEVLNHERLQDEKKKILEKLLVMFPDDSQVANLQKSTLEEEVVEALTAIRRQHDKLPKWTRRHDDVGEIPGLEEALEKVMGTLDSTTAYELAVGLSQMNLHGAALRILRQFKEAWTAKEWALEIELALGCQLYAEALGLSAQIREKFDEDPELIQLSVYFEAKALYGLNDRNKAASVLRGLVKASPEFRDARYLLMEWESRA